jgi:hypothetical protein
VNKNVTGDGITRDYSNRHYTIELKGTVAQDFRPPDFSKKSPPRVPVSYLKFVSG